MLHFSKASVDITYKTINISIPQMDGHETVL